MDAQKSPNPDTETNNMYDTGHYTDTKKSNLISRDSLAAESTGSGGVFASNTGSELPSTDILAATMLDPVVTAAAREENDAWREAAELKGSIGLKYTGIGSGQPSFPGIFGDQDEGYLGDSESLKQPHDIKSGVHKTYAATSTSTSSVGVNGLVSTESSLPSHLIPRNVSNAQENTFDNNSALPNASFTTEIGSADDPARAAELKFAKSNSLAAGSAAQMASYPHGRTSGQYNILKDQQL